MKRPISCLATVALALLSAPSQAQIVLDNLGREFLCGFLPNVEGGGSPSVELHLTGPTATSVTVEFPVNSPTFTTTVNVVPGSVTIVTVPAAASIAWAANAVANNLVRATAADEFVCYMINRKAFTSDAALALPVDVLNTEYILADYTPTFGPSQFVVQAEFDNTTVTITPSVNLVGHAVGVPFNVTLNRGQGYFGASLDQFGLTGSLTGTIVVADRRVGVTNGSECVQIPLGTTACDHVFEVAQPVQSWGLDALVANLPDRPSGTIYRILASADATQVTQDGANIALLNRGQFFETAPLTGNHVFAGNNAIFVCQYMTGNSSAGATTGDPAMGNMVPCEQYQSQYTFSTVGGSQFAANFLTVFARNLDVGVLTLDGLPIPAASYTAVPGSTFSAAVVPLSQGTHTTSAPGVHGITVEGYNTFDSYLYPGGALFQFINPTGDANPPLCAITPAANQTSASGTATDNRPSEDGNGNMVLDPGEDLNGNGVIDVDTGIFFVTLDVGATNLTLTVNPFTPGDGVVTFTLNLINTSLPGAGVVRVQDGAGNVTTCTVSLIGAECHLLLGYGAGQSNWLANNHLFSAQMHTVRTSFPVTMDSMPSFPLPAPGTINRPLRVQVVMWNPDMFPGNPSQWSQTLVIYTNLDGTLNATPVGTSNSIAIQALVITNPDGTLRMRFPFQIAGM